MQARYRSDYPGEFIVVETRWTNGSKQQTREWVSNPIENHHISGRAACIGSKNDREKFDYRRLQRHRGGLLGSKKLQTYGVGSIASDMRLDFAVDTNAETLNQLVSNNYSEDNIVYTSSKNCIQNPGSFYLIPYNPALLDLATIIYLAAFDGHNEVFLLGYNRDTQIDRADWHLQISKVLDAYSATRFFFVGESTNMFDDWFDRANASSLTYKEFVSHCDI